MVTKPIISIVSLTWNSARFVKPLLTTLLADIEASAVATEIIIIDNGSTRDDTVEQIRGFMRDHDNIHLVPLSKNHGTTASRNIGIRMARGEYVMILDSDTEMPRGTLRALVDSMKTIPDPGTIGIVHPRLVYPDGQFQESARRFPTVKTKAYRLLRMEDRRAARVRGTSRRRRGRSHARSRPRWRALRRKPRCDSGRAGSSTRSASSTRPSSTRPRTSSSARGCGRRDSRSGTTRNARSCITASGSPRRNPSPSWA